MMEPRVEAADFEALEQIAQDSRDSRARLRAVRSKLELGQTGGNHQMTKPPRSPILWFGGKGIMRAKIIPILEAIDHRTYVEPFGGGASVLLGKSPAPVDVYNDIDRALFEFFSVLCNPDLFELFYRRVVAAPYHRAIYEDALVTWRDEPDMIARVARWFIVARQSFGGRFGAGFGTVVTESSRGMADAVSTFLTAVDALPEVSARLRRVQIENADWRVILSRYDTEETLFYLDPPYVASTRKSGKYEHEITDDDQAALVKALLETKGSWVLSGYASDVYRPLEDDPMVRRVDIQMSCSAAGRTRSTGIQGKGSATSMQPRTETLWICDRRRDDRQGELFPLLTKKG